MKNVGKIGGILIAFVMAIILILLAFCTKKVPTGYVGIIYSVNKGVCEETLSQGWHIVSVGKKVTTYSVGIEQAYLTKSKENGSSDDDSFNIPTSDGKTVNVDIEFSYHFDEKNIAKTFTRFKGQNGKDIEKSFIKPKIKAWSSEVSANYSVMAIMGDKRSALNTEVKEYVAKKFVDYGIIIDTVNFTRMSTDKKTEQAIQNKVTAQQELETAKIKSETALVEAQQKVDVAKKEAETKMIKANAEAKANKVIAESLTSALIADKKIDKWNGKLPTVSGNGASTIIDMK